MKRVNLMLASVTTTLALTTAVAFAQAQTYTDSYRVPVSFTITDTCNGGFVFFDGYVHILTHTTVDEQGGVHVQFVGNSQEVSGTSYPSGIEYRSHSEYRSLYNTASGGLPVEFTELASFRMYSEGATENLILRVTFHVTINENGEVTADIIDVNSQCAG